MLACGRLAGMERNHHAKAAKGRLLPGRTLTNTRKVCRLTNFMPNHYSVAFRTANVRRLML
eukprot:7376709-Lingulodinium_polyedra.AAC.1